MNAVWLILSHTDEIFSCHDTFWVQGPQFLPSSQFPQNNTYRASQNQIWCLVQPQLSIFPAPSSVLATLLILKSWHTCSSENAREPGSLDGGLRPRPEGENAREPGFVDGGLRLRPEGGLTVLLMLANSFPLNSTMAYTAPFTSFSATVCSFPSECYSSI